MPKDFIPVARNVTTATNANDLLNLIAQGRAYQEQLQKVKSIMDHCWVTTDFVQMETQFGLATGTGATVYPLVRDALLAWTGAGTFASNVTLIERVG